MNEPRPPIVLRYIVLIFIGYALGSFFTACLYDKHDLRICLEQCEKKLECRMAPKPIQEEVKP